MYIYIFQSKVENQLFSFKEDNWIDGAGDWLKDNAGIDLTSHEDTKEWIQEAARKIGADFDTAGNCFIIYGETLD